MTVAPARAALAQYADQRGVAHKVLHLDEGAGYGGIVVDLPEQGKARLIGVFGPDEGPAQVEALVSGPDGYLPRAARSSERLARPVVSEDIEVLAALGQLDGRLAGVLE